MATPRYSKVDLSVTPFYHCISRCVRQAYLCGTDLLTGRSYEHRKQWLIDKIEFLTTVFSIQILSYAIMDNHYHIDVYINSDQADNWEDDEVIARWKQLFPKSVEQAEISWRSSSDKQEKVLLWRERLMNLSWFMRCLNQDIAEHANAEDERMGRFWEERFKSQALLDYGAVIASMVYIDLNPIRAKMAQTPEESDFTSVQERIMTMKEDIKFHFPEKKSETDIQEFKSLCDKAFQPTRLMPFDNNRHLADPLSPTIPMCLSHYLALVDETGRMIREDKKGAIPDHLLPILDRLNLSGDGWLDMVKNINNNFFNAIGSCHAMRNFSAKFCKKSIKGIKMSKSSYREAA